MNSGTHGLVTGNNKGDPYNFNSKSPPLSPGYQAPGVSGYEIPFTRSYFRPVLGKSCQRIDFNGVRKTIPNKGQQRPDVMGTGIARKERGTISGFDTGAI